MKTYKTVIIVTGPIAAGKDEFCRILRSKGAEIIDADKIGHLLLKSSSPVYGKVVRRFGESILGTHKIINRHKLADIVFSNKSNIKALNSIMHPEIRKIVKEKVLLSKRKYICINAALAGEIKLAKATDTVITVTASKGKRVKRLIAKRHLSRKDALDRISSQKPDRYYRSISDCIIHNNTDLASFKIRSKKLLDKILIGHS